MATATPAKNPHPSKISENTDPNIPLKTPSKKPTKTPIKPSPAAKKSSPQILKRLLTPPKPLERKFIVAKKISRKGAKDLDVDGCRKKAYEALRASQDDFFKNGPGPGGPNHGLEQDLGIGEGPVPVPVPADCAFKLRSSIPEPGSGRVKDLVGAFERMLITRDQEEADDGNQQSLEGGEGGRRFSAESFLSWRFVKDSDRVSSLIDDIGDRLSLESRKSKRNSTDTCRSSWNKKLKVTNQQPFKLRTEQRGRQKEEDFYKKVQEMIMEEEKKRIPVAQGLPWTTDEPEVLVKPPVKDSTEPIDLVLHSDVRAVERAEFDNYIIERMTFAEQLKLERERQQKLEEEEELRRLRRELVPKALPMPYFDRPFVPKRSSRPRTTPKEPRFHIRPKKTSCISALERC